MMLIDKIINVGLQKLGTPYVFNAPSFRSDMFDCSSFIQFIFGVYGIELPRNARQQFKLGTPISFGRIQKGDLLFFTTNNRKAKKGVSKIGHVALYLGGNKMLHTYRPENKVVITEIDSDWIKKLVAAKRIIRRAKKSSRTIY